MLFVKNPVLIKIKLKLVKLLFSGDTNGTKQVSAITKKVATTGIRRAGDAIFSVLNTSFLHKASTKITLKFRPYSEVQNHDNALQNELCMS